MKPLYEPGARAHAVLRFGWAGWPTSHTVFPRVMESCLTMPSAAWEGDGMRLFEYEFGPKRVLMTFGVTPQVAPVLFTARAKGRLDYALRVAKVGVSFSRKVAMCSLGENHRVEVESYIQNQVDKEPLADPAARETLRQFTVVDPEVDLSQPTATKSGRYWYNLHLVLVTEGRWRTCDPRSARQNPRPGISHRGEERIPHIPAVGHARPPAPLAPRQSGRFPGNDRARLSEQPSLRSRPVPGVAADLPCRDVWRVRHERGAHLGLTRGFADKTLSPRRTSRQGSGHGRVAWVR